MRLCAEGVSGAQHVSKITSNAISMSTIAFNDQDYYQFEGKKPLGIPNANASISYIFNKSSHLRRHLAE